MESRSQTNQPPLDGFSPQDFCPQGVKAISFFRQGGQSKAPFDSLNLGERAGDQPEDVTANRERVRQYLGVSVELACVRLVHGTKVIHARRDQSTSGLHASHGQSNDKLGAQGAYHYFGEADALFSSERDLALLITTADCLPVFFASDDGLVVGIAHAGWRGLAAGVLEATAKAMHQHAKEIGASPNLRAALGPAIGPKSFEVGKDVLKAFQDKDGFSEAFFRPTGNAGKYFANLYGLAALRLGKAGVQMLGRCDHCTYLEPERFFSFRRDKQTGRQASVILRGN